MKHVPAILLTAAFVLPTCVIAETTSLEPASKLAAVSEFVKKVCFDCHNSEETSGDLDLSNLSADLRDRETRNQWVLIHDRIENLEMPPDPDDLPAASRKELLGVLSAALHESDLAEVRGHGRGPIRRLNRDEYQQNLRDILALPTLDIRDMLPEDRESYHFNKTTESLDISRVLLSAYLDAAEAALSQAIASGTEPPPATKYRAVGRRLFTSTSTFGGRQAMFFAKGSQAIDNKQLEETPDDPEIELALFRSAHWPYFGYPQGFVCRRDGEYRVRFSARAVLQLPELKVKPATRPVPMTFRARKPSGPDVSGDVRATGGLIDVQPERADYETTIQLKKGETFEYSLLGLPVPLARNVNNGPPSYRYPPFPEGGQPGVAFQWLEVEGPLSPDDWPPPSHGVLFGDLPIRKRDNRQDRHFRWPVEVVSENPDVDARRLLKNFANRALRDPVSDESLARYLQIALVRIRNDVPFAESMTAAYTALLCSSRMIYLHEPMTPTYREKRRISESKFRGSHDDYHFAVASRLSHFLTNSRPDAGLMKLARSRELRQPDVLAAEVDRLIAGPGFDRFIRNFTDYWLNLRYLNRDEPDIRLFPEYRFDAYLLESMGRETREFVTAMFRDNLPAESLVRSHFVFTNDRLAEHYGLPVIDGSRLRKVTLPEGSPYGGLLTQAAILKVTANGTATSPVVRGAWIMDRLIGQPPPKPPASVPAVEPDIRGAKTIRELLARHTEDESCASCHARFDPVGLALENFDIRGAWRTRYRGLEKGEKVTGIDRAGHDFAYTLSTEIDSTGELLDGRRFQDIHELKELLARDPRQLARNLLHQFTVYATGTPIRFSDRSAIEDMLDRCAANGYRTRDLLHIFVQSRIFLGSVKDSESSE